MGIGFGTGIDATHSESGQSWVDGGLLDNVPIGGAFVSGANEIDVIVLFPKERD